MVTARAALRRLAPRFSNMTLRAVTIGSRFALIFGLAALLTPSELGLYGLIAATISFSMLFVGGEFYTYSQREMLSVPRDRWSFVLQHQAIAVGLLYLGLIPLQLLLFGFELLPWRWVGWFLLLLVMEHLAQELNRLLITMGRPVLAGWVLFVRTAAWVWPLLTVIWLFPELRRLEPVFGAWLLGGAMAVGAAVAVVVRDVAPWRSWMIDWSWIKRGFVVGSMYLVATLAYKAMFTADRYVVERLVGRDVLGVYVLYMGIATALGSFLDSAVFSFLYPRLVSAYQQHRANDHRQILREMAWSALGLSVILAAAAGLLAPVALSWIGKDVFTAHLPLLWILLATAVVQTLAMIPHYGLYARRADRHIIVAEVTALPMFGIVTAIVARWSPLTAAAWGIVGALTWLAASKYIMYRRLTIRDKLVA